MNVLALSQVMINYRQRARFYPLSRAVAGSAKSIFAPQRYKEKKHLGQREEKSKEFKSGGLKS